MKAFRGLCVCTAAEKYWERCSACDGWFIAGQNCQPRSITYCIFCINEILISIKLHCKDTEAFDLLTCACLGLRIAEMMVCCTVLLFKKECQVNAEPVSLAPLSCAIVFRGGEKECVVLIISRCLEIILTPGYNARDFFFSACFHHVHIQHSWSIHHH